MIISDSVREPRPAKIQAYKAVKDAAGLLKLDTRPSNILEFKAEPETATPLFKRIGLDDVTPPVWLVKSHIEEGTFAMVFGPSGAKKSFLVYDLACCIATGKDWHGNRVKQGAVLIICGEGHGGLNRRLKGWEKYNQQSLKDVPLYGNERPLTLTDDADIEALIAYIEDRISIDGTPNLIVVDTLERRQLAVIRSMSLNQTASDPRTINGSAKVEGEARAALRNVGVEGLIAQPAH